MLKAITILLCLMVAGCTAQGETPCTVHGATPNMICKKTPNGCSCELPHEAFMAEMRRRACNYKMAGIKLLPDVEKDLQEHPEVCPGVYGKKK